MTAEGSTGPTGAGEPTATSGTQGSAGVTDGHAVPVGPAPTSFWTGRGDLLVVAVLVAVLGYLVYGIVTMDVPPDVDQPGPVMFPTVVAFATAVLALLLTVQTLRRDRTGGPAAAEAAAPSSGDGGPSPAAERTDWVGVGTVVGSVVLFTVALNPVGWLLSGAALFWGVTVALGHRRYLFDAGVALAVSAVIQLAFSAGLGLNLPSGVLEGVF